MSVRQVWKRKTSTPKSSPPSQNDSPPLPPRVYLQSPSPPSYNPLRDQMINQLHNISTILDSHNNPSNAYIHVPPSPPPPQIPPPSHAQVEFHSSFCHCCKFSRHQFHSLRNEINFIHYLLSRPIPPTHAQKCKLQEVKAADASLRDTNNSGSVSDNGNAHSSDNNFNKTGNYQTLEKQSSTSGNDSYRSRNECNDRMVPTANLIANLKLDIDENKTVQKQLRKLNATLTHEPNECKSALAKSNDIRDRCRSDFITMRLSLRSKKVTKIVQMKKTSVYENFKPETRASLDQLYYANEARKKMWRKYFVKYNPNIAKNISFLPTQASLSKSRKAFNTVQHNINHFKTVVDLAWEKRMDNAWQQLTIQEITVLVINLLISLAIKLKDDAFEFENALKKEMFEYLEYVQSLEKEVDELQSDKNEFSKEYDLLLQECIRKDILYVSLTSMVNSDNYCDMACKYLDKIKECEHLEFELSKQHEFFKNKPTNLSNHSFESENIFLKKTVAQFRKDFSILEANYVSLEFKNQALQSGQHCLVLQDVDEIETINIELEHSVAKLLYENENLDKENEHLKQTYKDLYDSIKLTRAQTKVK
ncbi:hypothetical protein Tco_0961526, partial [Tanacetum coccineum]